MTDFDRLGNMPAAWCLFADSLLAAARLLKSDADHFNRVDFKVGSPVPDEGKIGAVERMLRGMAIECLLKALYLKRGNKLIERGKYRGIRGAADHDLLQLSRAVGVDFTTSQRDVLKRLSSYISGGRYPIPKYSPLYRPEKRGGSGITSRLYWVTPRDEETFTTIIDFLVKECELKRRIRLV